MLAGVALREIELRTGVVPVSEMTDGVICCIYGTHFMYMLVPSVGSATHAVQIHKNQTINNSSGNIRGNGKRCLGVL